MMVYRHHGSRTSLHPRHKRRQHLEVSISNYHHCNHRLTTMTTTSVDHDHGDQDDIKMEEDDFTPHQSHPGTETTENPTEFHTNPLWEEPLQEIRGDVWHEPCVCIRQPNAWTRMSSCSCQTISNKQQLWSLCIPGKVKELCWR